MNGVFSNVLEQLTVKDPRTLGLSERRQFMRVATVVYDMPYHPAAHRERVGE